MVDPISEPFSSPSSLPVINGPDGPMLCITYQGRSMHPQFIKGDKLLFDPDRIIKKGDVVAFFEPSGREVIIVHRVIQVYQDSIRTRGDNNSSPDPYVVPLSVVLGVVCYQNRAGILYPVQGGMRGIITTCIHPIRKKVFTRLETIIRPVYLHVAKTGLLVGLIKHCIIISENSSSSPDGKQIRQLFWKGFLVGYKREDQQEWYVRPPFRLCIDPEIVSVSPAKPEKPEDGGSQNDANPV